MKNATLLIILVILSLVIFITSSLYFRQKTATDKMYFNKVGVVVNVGNESGPSHDKFYNPTEYPKLLIRDTKDTTLFLEWGVTKEAYYNYNKGDTVRFRFIDSTRYFHIKR